MEDQNEMSQTPQETTPPIPTTQVNSNEKTWTLFCHLSGLLLFTSIPFANVIGPLVIWLIKKDEMPKVNAHGKAALNFQISMMIYFLVCIPLVFIIIGVFLMAGLVILNVIFTIIATIKAADGQVYDYPLSIKFLK